MRGIWAEKHTGRTPCEDKAGIGATPPLPQAKECPRWPATTPEAEAWSGLHPGGPGRHRFCRHLDTLISDF